MTTQTKLVSERHRHLSGFWRWLTIIFVIVGVASAINYVFDLRLGGLAMVEHSHYFLLFALFLSPAFLYFPIKSGIKGIWVRRLFWLDASFSFLCFGISLFLMTKGFTIVARGWSEIAPSYAIPMAVILWALLLEALRRAMGLILTVVILFFSVYPIFAEHMPGVLEGIGRSFTMTATFHMFSIDSATGLMMKTFSDVVMGYIAFGVVILATGGGEFFLNLALSLVGRTRGGPAKVAVMASAFFGSLSGSVIANVITTGSVTIPAMKKTGYPPHYAGAVECCASTGGALAPPVMGAVAFIMASFIGVSYVYVALAAAIPTVLYFFGLFVQVDAFAAKKGLRGQLSSEAPSFTSTLKDGWYYLPTVIALVYFLFVLRRIGEAPWIAAGICLILAQIGKKYRFTIKSFLQFIQQSGRQLTELCIVLSGVGMLVGSFAITGIAVSFSRELIMLAGGNVPLLLIFGAITSFILGMGMPAIACYVFLAIVLAPALVGAGLNIMAVHLFVLYCGLWSFITPPVALATFPAGVIAGAPALKIGAVACRLGGVIFLLPFLFVFDPSLIFQGEVRDILHSSLSALLGVFIIGSAFEGYLAGIGQLRLRKPYGYLLRAGLIISGVLLGLKGWTMDISGLAIAFVILSPMLLKLVLRLRSRKMLPRAR